MRRMMRAYARRIVHDERGAYAVLVAFLIVPMLGFGALALDMSAQHAERTQLQHGADSAAIAVAAECARDESSCVGTAQVTGDEFAFENESTPVDASAVLDGPHTGDNWVRVTAGAEFPHFLAGLIDGDSDPEHTTVNATAAAEWGVPVRGSVIPLAIADCELKKIETDPDLAKQIFLRSDNKGQDCPGSYPGGFGWLDDGDGDCDVTIGVGGYVDGTTGNNPGKTGCTSDDFKGLLGKTVLVPIYDGFGGPAGDKEKGGSHGKYHISKFAAFTVTGYKTSGSDDTYLGSSSPSFKGSKAGDCDTGGSCRGLRGYFVRYVDVGEGFELDDGAPDGGLSIVRLIE